MDPDSRFINDWKANRMAESIHDYQEREADEARREADQIRADRFIPDDPSCDDPGNQDNHRA